MSILIWVEFVGAGHGYADTFAALSASGVVL